MQRKRLALVSTGGTIEKTYDALSGLLTNQVSVLDVMARDIPAVRSREPLESALATLNRAKAPALFILGDDGRLEGILTPETIGELMLVQSVRPDWRLRRHLPERSPWTLARRD